MVSDTRTDARIKILLIISLAILAAMVAADYTFHFTGQ